MPKISIDPFISFLKNPQGEGVWCLNIDIPETTMKEIFKLLNISDFFESNAFRYRTSQNDDSGTFHLLFPRLFAYLRAFNRTKENKYYQPLLLKQVEDIRNIRNRFRSNYRVYRMYDDLSTPPHKISTEKKRKFHSASRIYMKDFIHYRFEPVPEDLNKINFFDFPNSSFFQITEEIKGQIKIMSPCIDILDAVANLIKSLPLRNHNIKKVKFFSPETTLMQMYLPVLKMVPLTYIVRDKTFAKNISSALNEIDEQRYPHSVRITGIATEEILVEIYETYIREKAPEVPLGSLITSLNEHINKIIHGDKNRDKNLGDIPYKEFGNLIEELNKNKKADSSLKNLIIEIQKSLLPILTIIRRDIDNLQIEKTSIQNVSLFPTNIQTAFSDILPLRNRVSHRVDKRITAPDIGYIDAVIAVKSLLMVGIWWYEEKTILDYSKDQKNIINQTISRSNKSKAS